MLAVLSSQGSVFTVMLGNPQYHPLPWVLVNRHGSLMPGREQHSQCSACDARLTTHGEVRDPLEDL